MPNARVKTTAETAEGIFNRSASPIDLSNWSIHEFQLSYITDSRKPKTCDNGGLVKVQPGSANREKGPAEKK